MHNLRHNLVLSGSRLLALVLGTSILLGCGAEPSAHQSFPPSTANGLPAPTAQPESNTLPSNPNAPTAQPASNIAPTSTPRRSYRILFDASHGETFGNADWVISTSQPDPLGENPRPRSESDWTGGLSAWGVALQQTGRYTLMTLPRGQTISYGDNSKQLDLSNFDVFIVPEPNIHFSSAEKTAIITFVQNGGGLFMIADHNKSDRNNDGFDSLHIWNDLMSNNSVQTHPFGFAFDELDIGTDDPRTIPASAAKHPVITGPFGMVTGSIIRSGTTATINPADNPNVQALIYRSRANATGNTGVFVLSSAFGQGRVVAWGDSSAVDDGTGASIDTLYDGWNDANGSDAVLALNASEWLAQGTNADPNSGASEPTAATPTVLASATESHSELVQNGDFEHGTNSWRVRGNNNRNIIDTMRVHAGSASVRLCGYNNCSESLSQTIHIPAGVRTVPLQYFVAIVTQETNHSFDFLTIELRDANGKRLRSVQKLGDGDTSDSWQLNTVDLSEYAGQTVQLVFSATSGRMQPTTFFIDDVSISAQ